MSASVVDQIETAILFKNYQLVESVSRELLDGPDLNKEDRAHLLYYLGLSQLNQEAYKDALDTFQTFVNEEPDADWRDRAYLGLYNAYFFNGQFEQALEAAETLLDLNPQSNFLSMIHLKIARAQLKLANWSQARQHLQTIVTDFPGSLDIYTARQFLNEKQYFAVQVGSFQDKDRATQLVDELRLKDQYAYIVETIDSQSQTFYRVRIGQLGKLREAEQLRTQLSEQGYPALVYP